MRGFLLRKVYANRAGFFLGIVLGPRRDGSQLVSLVKVRHLLYNQMNRKAKVALVEHCIAQGVPMRAAHDAVGKLVKLCEQRRCRLADLAAAASILSAPACRRGYTRC